MTPPRPSGVLRWLQSQPQHVVAVLALLIALLLCALVAKDLVRDRGQQLAAAQSKTSGLTHLLEEHTRQTMRRVELSLSLAAQELQAQYLRQGRISPANGPSLRAFLPQDGLIACQLSGSFQSTSAGCQARGLGKSRYVRFLATPL